MSASLANRRAHLVLERDLIDAAGGGALHLLGGTMAATPEAAPEAPPLCIVALPVPSCALHATDATMALLPAQGFAAVGGLVTWGRFVDGAGNAVRDVLAGPPGSTAPLIVSNGQAVATAQVYAGGEVNVSGTFARP